MEGIAIEPAQFECFHVNRTKNEITSNSLDEIRAVHGRYSNRTDSLNAFM